MEKWKKITKNDENDDKNSLFFSFNDNDDGIKHYSIIANGNSWSLITPNHPYHLIMEMLFKERIC